MTTHLVFLMDLVQDVAVCRPLAVFAKREKSWTIVFLVTTAFRKRDVSGLWGNEIREICGELDAKSVEIADVLETVLFLEGKGGLLVSSSESHLENHRYNRDVFAAAPSSFVRVTLQHGFECIGFNHNKAHDQRFGDYVGLSCDIAACWFDLDCLHSVRPDQRAKMMPTGPQIGLDAEFHKARPRPGSRMSRESVVGLICENLHSVRFAGQGIISSFLDTFSVFADKFGRTGGSIALRPHPAGQYTRKKDTQLLDNVTYNSAPLYKQALRKFDFCISAPSSILFDLVWAGVPVAVWTTGADTLDIGIYEGLAVVKGEEDWLSFAANATRDPTHYLAAQESYVAKLGIPGDITGRYRSLLATVA